MESIEIKGFENLSEAEKQELNKEIETYKDKIKWKTKSDFVLKLAIKSYNKNPENKTKGKRYSIKAEVTGQTQTFEASAEDWDFNKTVHKIFDKLINEIEHRYHSSEQGKGK
jgi:ribosome-associated translation inhibitor RaiA